MKQEPMPNLKKKTIYYISTNIGAIDNVYHNKDKEKYIN